MEYSIKVNPVNNDLSCVFCHEGKWYYADMAVTTTGFSEFTVFECDDESGRNKKWTGIASYHDVEMSVELFGNLIDEFKSKSKEM